jgi:hypothetical protein
MTHGGPISVKMAGPNLTHPEHYWEKDEYIYGSLAARAVRSRLLDVLLLLIDRWESTSSIMSAPTTRPNTHDGVINTDRVITTGKELMPCLFPDNHPNFVGKGDDWDTNQIICAHCDVHWTASDSLLILARC